MRTRIHCPIVTEVNAFSFYPDAFLNGGGGGRCTLCRFMGGVFPGAHFAFCSSSTFWKMSRKATATAAWNWKDPEDPDQTPGPHPSSAPHHVPLSPPHDPHELPPRGASKPWKARHSGPMRAGKELSLPKEAYEAEGKTPTQYWWTNPDGMWLQNFWCMLVDLRALIFHP